MAAAFVRQVGGAAGTAAGSVVVPVTAASAAGDAILVVAAVSDNGTKDFGGCTDTKGNVYAIVQKRQHSTASVAHIVYMARNATALTTADSITVTHGNTANLITAGAYEFSGLTAAADLIVGAQSATGGLAYDTGSGTAPAGGHLLFSVGTATGPRTLTPTGAGAWTALTPPPDVATQVRRPNPFFQVVTGGGTVENVGTLDGTGTPNWIVDAVSIPATATNIAPTANAGPDQTGVEPWSTVTLDGSGSSDPDGSIASYAWSQTAGPAVTLSGTGATRTFAAPGTLAGATLTFSLTVTDNAGATSTADTVTVTVLPAPAAVAVGGVLVPARFVVAPG